MGLAMTGPSMGGSRLQKMIGQKTCFPVTCQKHPQTLSYDVQLPLTRFVRDGKSIDP
jgi:hypothetical protein